MKRIFASFTFRYVVCVVLQLPFVAYASTTHDANSDGDIDLHDFASLQRCYVLPDQDCKDVHDCEPDDDLDAADFADFESVMTDPNWVLPDAPLNSAGYPRSWEGALPVNDFSVYNLAKGNLHTAVPLVSWDPVGPPVEFTLYHNNAMAAHDESGADGQGFDLGDGWSTSYSGRLVISAGSVNVIEDDGTRNTFTLSSGVWLPPTSVHDRLEHVTSGGDYWLLTRTDQSQRVFDPNTGLLDSVRDSSGNEVAVVRDANDVIEYVESAADGLTGVGDNRLSIDVHSSYIHVEDPIGRDWYLRLDGNGVLEEVEYPHDSSIDPASTLFTYDDDSRLERICRRDRVTWEHQYTDGGRLEIVIGPYYSDYTEPGEDPDDPLTDPPVDAYEMALTDLRPVWNDCLWQRTFTDRRGNDWEFDFDNSTTTVRLLVATHDPLDNTRSFTYDADRNIASFTNELDNTWEATYGPVGNLETLTGPEITVGGQAAQQTWTLTWEAPADPNTSNHYQLTQITDPASKWVQYKYDDANDATLVTKVVEMPDGQGDPNADTELHYYWTDSARGQLWYVKDANGVITHYAYDEYGYFQKLDEGLDAPPGALTSVFPSTSGPFSNNGAGQPTGGSDDTGCGYWGLCIINGSPTWVECTCILLGNNLPIRLSNTVQAPYFEAAKSCLDSAEYDVMGRPTLIEQGFGGDGDSCSGVTRAHEMEYNELGRLCKLERSGDGSDPNSLPPTTIFEFKDDVGTGDPAYDPDGRLLRQLDEDDHLTKYTYDELGRLETVTRNYGEATAFGATLSYDEAGRLVQLDYSNGAREIRVYDDADRLTEVRHQDALQGVLHETTYIWTINNWVDTRTEEDWTSGTLSTAVVDFEYDNRGRLISEERTVGQTDVYDLAYTYDQLSNRQTKVDAVSGQWVVYDYDVDLVDPNTLDYPTWHNCLLEYRMYDRDPNDPNTILLRTVSYTYYKTGQASNITVKDEDPTGGSDPAYDVYYDLALYYHSHGPLWRALWGSYTLDQSGDPTGYETSWAREFFYDSPRQRFLAADYDTNGSDDPDNWTRVEPALWTDHAGESPYRDRDFQNDAFTDALLYLGTAAEQTVSTGDTAFHHGDLIGSTNLTTDDSGDANQTSAVAYTAFGEVIGDASTLGTRHQYAGAYGYESDLLALSGVNPNLPDITLQHVGHRWYQPDIGRFVQRDPIGILGGLNVYDYVAANPLATVDPAGLTFAAPLGLGQHYFPDHDVWNYQDGKPGFWAGCMFWDWFFYGSPVWRSDPDHSGPTAAQRTDKTKRQVRRLIDDPKTWVDWLRY